MFARLLSILPVQLGGTPIEAAAEAEVATASANARPRKPRSKMTRSDSLSDKPMAIPSCVLRSCGIQAESCEENQIPKNADKPEAATETPAPARASYGLGRKLMNIFLRTCVTFLAMHGLVTLLWLGEIWLGCREPLYNSRKSECISYWKSECPDLELSGDSVVQKEQHDEENLFDFPGLACLPRDEITTSLEIFWESYIAPIVEPFNSTS